MACGLTVAGNSVYIKYHATNVYSIASTTANIATGRLAPTAGVDGGRTTRVIGYETTRGDRTANRPTIRAGVNGTGLLPLVALGTNSILLNVVVDGNKANYTAWLGIICTSATNAIEHCRITGIINERAVVLAGGRMRDCIVDACENNTASEGVVRCSGGILIDCVFSGCSATGTGDGVGDVIVQSAGPPFIVIRCIAINNTGHAFNTNISSSGVNSLLVNCIAYNNTKCGFYEPAHAGGSSCLVNCIASTNGEYGYKNADDDNYGTLDHCAAYANVSGTYLGYAEVTSFVALTAGNDPFTNAAGNDFSLNATANRGALLRAAGIPGAFPGISTTGYIDIGAVQHADPAGGGLGADMIFMTGGRGGR